ncbi:MAG: CidA/LrgA family protein [Lachnospiraceae bacterium]|nr:CidA/LrgA family protein [Lachnospiraceae bacterium]
MKYIKQFAIIIVISFIGEFLNHLIPLPVPASIYGMVILFVCLLTGVIRLEWVKDIGHFLIEIMPVMFVPICVGVMDVWADISSIWFSIFFITMLTTVIVMAVTGRASQWIIRRTKPKKEDDHE